MEINQITNYYGYLSATLLKYRDMMISACLNQNFRTGFKTRISPLLENRRSKAFEIR